LKRRRALAAWAEVEAAAGLAGARACPMRDAGFCLGCDRRSVGTWLGTRLLLGLPEAVHAGQSRERVQRI
jgi:hypothetical protein